MLHAVCSQGPLAARLAVIRFSACYHKKQNIYSDTKDKLAQKRKELSRLRLAGLEFVFSVFSKFEQTQTFQEKKNGYVTTPRTLLAICNLKISSITNISFKFVNS